MISLLVISDIHASDNDLGADGAVSWYSTLPAYNSPTRNPFHGVPKLLKNEKLSVDLLLCPGDLADCAVPTSQEKAWESLEKLRRQIGAKRLIATVGNHDIDSRTNFSPFDPKTTLQSLTPVFPGLSEEQCDFFWSRNFVIFEEAEVRFVVLNSAAFHGIHSGDPADTNKEYLHGRVSDKTIEAIASKLGNKKCKLNILLMHHHVYKNDHIISADYSEMKNGEALIRKLIEISDARWLVIHGHQHYPDLFYARGAARSPVVLSAGSMSRRLTGALSTRALNQIYHVELPISNYEAIGWNPCGVIRSWHWTDKIGWRRTSFARPESASIPFGSGFGCRKDPDFWADEIKNEFNSLKLPHMNWSTLMQRLPALRYVLPADLRVIIDALRAKHKIRTLNDDEGFPVQIGQP
jgi:predicted phosphodiesterase